MNLINKLGGIEALASFPSAFSCGIHGLDVLAFCLKKPFLKNMSALPLEDERSPAKNSNSDPL
jgi:hypothetical protein